MSTRKPATSYRLSTEAIRLINALTKRLGINRTSVIEMAVRELARDKGVR